METQQMDAFRNLPPTPKGHFSAFFYAAVHALVGYIVRLHGDDTEALETYFRRYPFLAHYYAAIAALMPQGIVHQDGRRWWQTEIESWERILPDHLPLKALAAATDLSFENRLALLLAGLGEEDSRFGSLFADLQEPLPYRRPTWELLGQAIQVGTPFSETDAWSVCRPLLELGLLQVSNASAPRAEWLLQVPALLWDVIRGETALPPTGWCRLSHPQEFPMLDDLIFPESFLQQVRQVPVLLSGDRASTLVVRGMPGSERVPLIGAIARAADSALLIVTNTAELTEEQRRQIGPLCTMLQAWPVLILEPDPGETIKPPDLPGYRGTVGIVLGIEGGLDAAHIGETITLTLPLPTAADRKRIWQIALGSHPVAEIDTIAESFRLPGGLIRQVAPLAINQATLEAQQAVTPAHVRTACRMLNRQILDSLATRLEVEGHWDQLIVSPITGGRLQELERRCRHRERLPAALSPVYGSTAKQGVSALFTGVSGTGKTFAARILAAELQMDLYRVDLAAIVNKYIGETEKNLNRVLSHAEALDVILLLDEGDALLGARTEVKSSNDRYANLETNYLLQRLETYQGIVIVTTNAAEHIDTAFQRRIDVVVPFVAPDAEARWQIWQLHLPENHAVSSALLDRIATRCALTGGQIRNAALYAALHALDDGVVVSDAHVEAAVQSEYRKAGATVPFGNGNRQGVKGQINGTGHFLQAMAGRRS